MKGLLQAAAAVLALALITLALVLLFGTLEQSRRQPAALAPTPTPQVVPPILTNLIITPTVSSTPRPTPSVIIDPTWNPPTPSQFPAMPTPTPLPATGGPYISEEQAIAIALRAAQASGTVNERAAPKAIFTPAKNVAAIIGKATRGTESELETWVVFTQGRFPLPRAPKPLPREVFYGEHWVVIDATTGEIDAWGLRNELP